MRASGVRLVLIVWAILAGLSVLWSLATPIAAAPDEPAHMIKAASVVRGQWVTPPTAIGSPVEVPGYVAFTHSLTCFAFASEITADCAPAMTGGPSELVPAHTTAGLYNPVYYLLVGWPTLIFDDVGGLYAMRIVSALLSSLFLALGLVRLLLLGRTIAMLGGLIAVTPMILFLGGVVNPNALEATATFAAFATVWSVARNPGPLVAPATIVAVSASIALTMRGLSPLWVLIALLTPLLLADRRRVGELFRARPIVIAMGVIAAAAAFALGWILTTNSLNASLEFTDGPIAAPGIGTSPLTGFLMILAGTVAYNQGLIGVFGWLDTPSPITVFFVWSAFLGALLVLAATIPRGRPRLLVLVLLGGLVLLPPIVQAAFIYQGGLVWQGRYALPIFLCLVGAAAVALAQALPADFAGRRGILVTVATAWALCQAYAFATALRRYSVGLEGEIADMIRDPAWSPPGGVVPLVVLFGLLALGTGALAVAREWRAPATSRP